MTLGNNIAKLRKAKGMTQEALANALGVTNQAVSKWESGQSCPDIALLPALADLFGITLDELFGRAATDLAPVTQPEPAEEPKAADLPWPDDGDLRVVLYAGHTLIGDGHASAGDIHFHYEGPALNVHSALSVYCDTVNGSVSAGGDVSCDEVNGSVTAGGDVSSNDVYGNVRTEGNVTCDDVKGGIHAGGSVTCDCAGGSISAGGNVTCDEIDGGEVRCGGNFQCDHAEDSSIYAGGGAHIDEADCCTISARGDVQVDEADSCTIIRYNQGV